MMVSLFVALSLISLWIVRRFCKPLLFTEHTEFGEIFSSAIGVVFGLILAFWRWRSGKIGKVDDNVFREANSLHNIYRNLEAYPEPVKTQSKNLIRQYVQVVINDESVCPLPEHDDHSHLLLNRIKALILTLIPERRQTGLHQGEPPRYRPNTAGFAITG